MIRLSSRAENENWGSDRALTIGGSEIGTVVGVNKFQSEFSLYQKKRKMLETGKAEQIDSPFLRYGSAAEAFIAEEFIRQSGQEMLPNAEGVSWGFDDVCVCTPDGWLMNKNQTTGIWEAKTSASPAVAKMLNDGDIPLTNYSQLVWNMGCTGLPTSTITYLSMGNPNLKSLHLDAEPATFADLVAAAHAFIDDVKAGRPPAPRSDDLKDSLLEVWKPEVSKDVSELPKRQQDLIAEYVKLADVVSRYKAGHKAELKEPEERLADLKAKLVGWNLNAIKLESNLVLSVKKVHRKEFMNKATSYFQVSIKNPNAVS